MHGADRVGHRVRSESLSGVRLEPWAPEALGARGVSPGTSYGVIQVHTGSAHSMPSGQAVSLSQIAKHRSVVIAMSV
jgi:hypothetical protein